MYYRVASTAQVVMACIISRSLPEGQGAKVGLVVIIIERGFCSAERWRITRREGFSSQRSSGVLSHPPKSAEITMRSWMGSTQHTRLGWGRH
jgi:hypothetical protein